MISQSGPKPVLRGNETTHLPDQSFITAYPETSPDARQVPMAAPFVPNAGIGPSPRIRITLNTMFSTVRPIPNTIGVRASPADLRAPPSMKKISIPVLNTNMMRRKGSASAFTAGAAFTKSSSHGDATYPTGAMINADSPTAVRKAW